MYYSSAEKRFRCALYVYMALIIVIAIVVGLPATFGQEAPPPIPARLFDEEGKPRVAPPEPEAVYQITQGSGIAPEYPAYSLARFSIGDVTAAIDVYTIYNGQVFVTEAVETKRKGEFVFTGPPGKYTIRITTYDPTKGFATVTANTTIKGGTGPIPVDPVLPPPVEPIPPVPVDPGSPSTGPPAEGRFGIGLVAYNWLVTNRPSDARGIKELATIYEWAGTVKVDGNNAALLNAELKARIDPIYAANPNLADLRKVMQAQATRLISKGLLKTFDEFQQAYKETALGFRAAYGK